MEKNISDEFTSGQFKNNNDNDVQPKMNEEAQSGGFGNYPISGEEQLSIAGADDQSSEGRRASSGPEGQFGNSSRGDQRSGGLGNDEDSSDSETGEFGKGVAGDEQSGQGRQGSDGGFGGNNN